MCSKLPCLYTRVLSDKKRLETSAGGQGRIRDVETEELIEDQQQRIRYQDIEGERGKEREREIDSKRAGQRN